MKTLFATTRSNGATSTTRTDTWKVTPAKAAPAAPRHLLGRMFRREEPTTFQRCLAVHIHFAAPRRGLS